MKDIVIDNQSLFLTKMSDLAIPLIKGSLHCEFATLRVHRPVFSFRRVGLDDLQFIAECEIVVSRLLDGQMREGKKQVRLIFLPHEDGIKLSFEHDRYDIFDDSENKFLTHVIPRFGRSEHAEE